MLRLHFEGVGTTSFGLRATLKITQAHDGAGAPNETGTNASLEDLDQMIQELTKTRHMLRAAHQHHSGCPECTLAAVEGKGAGQ